jgi:NADH-quinone oxidoreductase subunit G
MGIKLEDGSVSAVFERLAASIKSFEGLTYAKISEVKPQWPIVGRGDMYYGGTTYENTMGLGAHLAEAAAAGRGETVEISRVPRETPLRRPRENELLAVPVNKLYDRGTTVMMSADLLRDRIGGPTIALHPEAAKNLGVEAGQLVHVSFDGVSGEARVKLDDTISVGVALVPREMGFAIREPIPAQISVPEQVE